MLSLRLPAAVAAAIALVVPLTVAAGSAAAPSPKLGLITASSTAEGTVYIDEEEGEEYWFLELDLGIHVSSGKDPFELRAVRRSYEQQVEATQVTPAGERRLPAGLVKDLSGLTDFATLKLTNSRNKVVMSQSITFCPNSYAAQRIAKDAPSDSYYPRECAGWNPYALGAVWGIQRGYAVPLLGEEGGFFDGVDGSLPAPGRYRAQVTINPAYATALGIARSAATVTQRVKIVEGDFGEGEEEEFRAAVTGRPDHAHTSPAAKPGKPPVRAAAIPANAPKPDLRSLPAWGIAVEGNDVIFSATVWNAGPSPLVVDGFRRRGADIMDAYQYVFDGSGQQLGYAKVGTMVWDPREEHHHWHFKDFAKYSLVDKNKKQVKVSNKEAFCLANTDAVDYTIPGADWDPGSSDLETSCGERGSLAVRETLASGSGDTYEQYRPGQALSLKGLPNGTYYIKVEANPTRNLTESDTSNNVSYRKITVGGKTNKRTVKAEKVGIVEEPEYDEDFFVTFRH